MTIKRAVLRIVLAAFASEAVADIPDGKGGRTSPQAGRQQATTSVARKCCEKTVAGSCKELIVREAKGNEPRMPPQRTSVVATPLRCKHMAAPAGGIEPRVPPQRAAVTAQPAARRACCENPAHEPLQRARSSHRSRGSGPSSRSRVSSCLPGPTCRNGTARSLAFGRPRVDVWRGSCDDCDARFPTTPRPASVT